MGVAGPNRRGGPNQSRTPRSKRGASGPRPSNGAHSKKNAKLLFTIPSDYTAGHEVQEQILAGVEKQGFSGPSFFAVKLALEEAIVNAIKHGNRLDPFKKVRIEARLSPGRAEILIEDEGPGFDRTGVPDPTAAENLEKCSGRGILLIEAYMNRVQWDRGGRRLRMIKEC